MTPSWPIKKIIVFIHIQQNGDVTEFVAPCKRANPQDFSIEGHGSLRHNPTGEAIGANGS